jgi:hypothetical protein
MNKEFNDIFINILDLYCSTEYHDDGIKKRKIIDKSVPVVNIVGALWCAAR